jgi:hypothetical protein
MNKEQIIILLFTLFAGLFINTNTGGDYIITLAIVSTIGGFFALGWGWFSRNF